MELRKRFHGVIAYKPGMVDINGKTFGNDFCGDPALIKEEDSCHDVVDNEGLDRFFKKQCTGRNECKLDIMQFIDYKHTEVREALPQCYHQAALMYLQYECVLPSSQDIMDRHHYALNIIVFGVLATIILKLTLYYVESTTDLDFKLWDVKTCTPADYTVQLKLTNGMYNQYVKYKAANREQYSTMKDYLREHFEEVV